MQQQLNNTTSNLQIKLITDARKLLEKVRNQQVLSANSSLDSSFLFDDHLHDSKGASPTGIKKGSSSTGDNDKFKASTKDVEITMCNSNLPPSFTSRYEEGISEPQSIGSNSNEQLHRVNASDHTRRYTIEENKTIDEVHEENVKLHIENYQLKEEMNEFEYKLSCLERTLGIIQEVEQSSSQSKTPQETLSIPITSKNSELPYGVTMDYGTRLSPVTALVADAMIEGTGTHKNLFTKRDSGIDAPPPTPLSKSQEHELQVLRENNEKMVTAIRALAQATIAQTRKHYIYKKRHHMTKKMVAEESEKTNQLMAEKDQLQSEFYDTRANYLREKDIREELLSELQFLAKKNNVMKNDKQKEKEVKMKVLEQLESRDDSNSVLSRLSQSSCFPVLQSITETNNNMQKQKENITRPNNTDKSLQKLVFKLISQLKKRDDKIEKLEANLKISMQYLQGALELEVARQDAEIELSKEQSKRTILTIERIEI